MAFAIFEMLTPPAIICKSNLFGAKFSGFAFGFNEKYATFISQNCEIRLTNCSHGAMNHRPVKRQPPALLALGYY
jgi:hypothetical protein